MNRELSDAYGGFNDLASFRAELGADVAGISDEDARRIIDESLRERAKLPEAQRIAFAETKEDRTYEQMNNNLRAQKEAAEAEKLRLARELAEARAAKKSLDSELSLARSSRSLLSDELELEKTKRLLGDRFSLRSQSSLDDYLTKERLKREVKEELANERRREQREKELAKLWITPKARSPTKLRAKSKSKSKAKSKTKSKTKKK